MRETQLSLVMLLQFFLMCETTRQKQQQSKLKVVFYASFQFSAPSALPPAIAQVFFDLLKLLLHPFLNFFLRSSSLVWFLRFVNICLAFLLIQCKRVSQIKLFWTFSIGISVRFLLFILNHCFFILFFCTFNLFSEDVQMECISKQTE